MKKLYHSASLKLLLGFVLVSILAAPASEAVSLGKLVKKIQPAVVTIITYDLENKPLSIGSGFFVDRQGHLVTNYHVLKGAYAAVIRT